MAKRQPAGQKSSTSIIQFTVMECLESRMLFSVHNDSFDVTQLTQLRNDPTFSSITGTGIGIAVLDTGVDAQNPDLSSKVKAYYNAVEDAIPASITSASVSSASDSDGHGTHTSGIAASADPNIGVAYGASLIDVKVLPDSGETQLSGDPLLRGLDFVQDFASQFNIKVVSMSLGEAGTNGGLNLNSVPAADDISREIQTLESLGITVVSAAGNSYANDPISGESYPAVVSTISVASTWSDTGAGYNFNTYAYGASNDNWAAVETSAQPDQFSATSQRSTLSNQVVAPGVNIYSDWNGSSAENSGSDLLHNTLSGTSMATPFVSGLVALMQQAAYMYGGRYVTNPQQILSIIKATSDVIQDPTIAGDGRVPISNGSLVSSTESPLPGTGDAYDRVNVFKAIQAVKALFTGTISNADTDNTAAAATSVPDLNGTAVFTENGNIGTDGLNQVGVNDVDVYKLVLDSPGTLSVALSLPTGGTSFTSSIRFFDSTGTELSEADGTSADGYPTLTAGTTTPLATGTYYIGISSMGNNSYSIADGTGKNGGSTTGDYSVSFSLSNPDPNGVPQGAVAVDLTSPNTSLANNVVANYYQGTLGSDPAPTGSTTRISVPNGDVDMFKIIAPDTGELTALADVSAYPFYQGADTYTAVFDSNFNQLASNGQSSSFGSNSTVQVPVTVGQTYYVAVTVYDNKTFNPTNPFARATNSTAAQTSYDLYFTFNNGNTNGTALLATPAAIGQAINGDIGSSNPLLGANHGSKYVNWYAYNTNTAGLLDLSATATSSGFSPSVGLWALSSDHNSVIEIGTTTGSDSHLIDQVTAGETIYVSTTGQGNTNFNWDSLGSGNGGQTGTYSLASALRPLTDLKLLNDGSIDNGTPQTIATGQIISGNLGMYNGLIVGDTAVDLYKFTPNTTGLYDIRTDTSQEGSADTLLRLFDVNGNQIATNDNAGSATTASFIRASLTAGVTYYIGVSSSGNATYDALTGTGAVAGNSTGNYVLGVMQATKPAISVANAATVEAPGSSGAVSAIFNVSLDFTTTSAITVNYTTADSTAIAGTDYTATAGTLTFPAGTASQTVSVPILADANASGSLTFFLNLSSPSSNVVIAGGEAAGTITSLPVTKLTLNAKTAAHYTDSAGHAVIIRLSGAGTGQVSVIGSGVEEQVRIVLNNSTALSRLTINGNTPSITALSDIQINGSLAALIAPRVDLEGDLTITGTIRNLQLAKADGGHTLAIDGTALAATLRLGDVSDLTVSTTEPIAALIASEWLNTSGNDIFTVPSIKQFNIAGAFIPSLILNGGGLVLGTAHVGGKIGGTWTVDGSVGTIMAASTTSAWAATFTGDINSFIVNGAMEGSLTAQSIRTLRVKKDLSQAIIHVTGTSAKPAITALAVGGTISNSQILAGGDINTVRVGAILDSTIFAGVAAGTNLLPTDPATFTASDRILSFTVTGLPGSVFAVSNSIIAADTIQHVNIRKVDSSNGGTPFGFAAQTIDSVVDIQPGQKTFRWTSKQLVSDLAFAGDFKVAVL